MQIISKYGWETWAQGQSSLKTFIMVKLHNTIINLLYSLQCDFDMLCSGFYVLTRTTNKTNIKLEGWIKKLKKVRTQIFSFTKNGFDSEISIFQVPHCVLGSRWC